MRLDLDGQDCRSCRKMTPRRNLRRKVPALITLVSLLIILATDFGYLNSLRRMAALGCLVGIGLEAVYYYLDVRKKRQKVEL